MKKQTMRKRQTEICPGFVVVRVIIRDHTADFRLDSFPFFVMKVPLSNKRLSQIKDIFVLDLMQKIKQLPGKLKIKFQFKISEFI